MRGNRWVRENRRMRVNRRMRGNRRIQGNRRMRGNLSFLSISLIRKAQLAACLSMKLMDERECPLPTELKFLIVFFSISLDDQLSTVVCMYMEVCSPKYNATGGVCHIIL